MRKEMAKMYVWSKSPSSQMRIFKFLNSSNEMASHFLK